MTPTTPAIRTIPIPPALAAAARASRRSPQYGHPAHAELATGHGPCRACLRPFRAGEERRLLFTYDPFDGLDPLPLPGPVFIHEDACPPWDGDGFPAALAALPFVLEAWGPGHVRLRHAPAAGAEVAEAGARLLAEAGVAYVHVRHAEAGCYVARLERRG